MDQEGVFNTLGMDVFQAAWDGYNSTLFAYGQSGSGKTYSMTGARSGEHAGIIPRTCKKLIERCQEQMEGGELKDYDIKISIVQIYLEKISDLLSVQKGTQDLKCGNISNTLGWGVPAAARVPVASYADIETNLELCEKRKAYADTGLNSTSSRGHTIMTIFFSRTTSDGMVISTKINLVDLAGSERLGKTGVTGQQAAEGRSINLSLSTLGNVIRALGKKNAVPPYRQSQLTMLLRESLSMNSKTIMIAALNPCPSNYDETVSTLKFADGVSKVKLPAKKNIQTMAQKRASAEAANQAIQELQIKLMEMNEVTNRNKEMENMISELKRQLAAAKEEAATEDDFDTRMQEARRENAARVAMFQEMGLATKEELEGDTPRITNLSEDPTMVGQLVFAFPEGKTVVLGRYEEESEEQDHANILLRGPQVCRQHCRFENDGGDVYITPLYPADDDSFETTMNGQMVTDRTLIEQGSRLWIGTSYAFCFSDPSKPPPEQEVDYKFAYTELLRRDGYKDPEEVQRELQKKTAELRDEMDRRSREQEEAALERERLMREEYERKLREMSAGGSSGNKAEIEREMKRQQEQIDREREKMVQQLKQEQKRQEQQYKEEMFRTRVQNRLFQLYPLIRKANKYAKALQRPVEFEGVIRSRKDVAGGGGKGGLEDSDVFVQVKKKWTKEKSVAFLEGDEFRDRFMEMQELYETAQRALKNKEELEIPIMEDPFYVPPIPVVFGRFPIFLFDLAMNSCYYMEDEDPYQETEISSTIGLDAEEVIGTAVYKVEQIADSASGRDIMDLKTPATPAAGTPMDFVIEIKEVKDLCSPFANNVFLSFQFFGEKDPIVSEVQNGEIVDHAFEFEREFHIKSSREFIEYCQNEALLVQLWGCPPESNQYKFPILTANLKTPPLEKYLVLETLDHVSSAPPRAHIRSMTAAPHGGSESGSGKTLAELEQLKQQLQEKDMALLEERKVARQFKEQYDRIIAAVRKLKDERDKLRHDLQLFKRDRAKSQEEKALLNEDRTKMKKIIRALQDKLRSLGHESSPVASPTSSPRGGSVERDKPLPHHRQSSSGSTSSLGAGTAPSPSGAASSSSSSAEGGSEEGGRHAAPENICAHLARSKAWFKSQRMQAIYEKARLKKWGEFRQRTSDPEFQSMSEQMYEQSGFSSGVNAEYLHMFLSGLGENLAQTPEGEVPLQVPDLAACEEILRRENGSLSFEVFRRELDTLAQQATELSALAMIDKLWERHMSKQRQK